jgi:hypothetical protein
VALMVALLSGAVVLAVLLTWSVCRLSALSGAGLQDDSRWCPRCRAYYPADHCPSCPSCPAPDPLADRIDAATLQAGPMPRPLEVE